jgi:hypothetical protein
VIVSAWLGAQHFSDFELRELSLTVSVSNLNSVKAWLSVQGYSSTQKQSVHALDRKFE